MEAELWLQAFRFWRSALLIRRGQDNGVILSYQEKINELDYQLTNFAWDKRIHKKFDELRQEVMKEAQENGTSQQTKTAS